MVRFGSIRDRRRTAISGRRTCAPKAAVRESRHCGKTFGLTASKAGIQPTAAGCSLRNNLRGAGAAVESAAAQTRVQFNAMAGLRVLNAILSQAAESRATLISPPFIGTKK
jgi:hypothetical protein